MKTHDLENRSFAVSSLANKSCWELVFGQFMRWDFGLERLMNKWTLSCKEKLKQAGITG